ncbi:Outer dense fiber [Sparganum proliferum]
MAKEAGQKNSLSGKVVEGSPIYVRVARNVPLHLHIETEGAEKPNDKPQREVTNANTNNKSSSSGFTQNVPWIPPPGKTSAGRRPLCANDDGNRRCLSQESPRIRFHPLVPASDGNTLHRCPTASNRDDECTDVPGADAAQRDSTRVCTWNTKNATLTSRFRPQVDDAAIPDCGAQRWATTREWLREIDRSVDRLSTCIRDILQARHKCFCESKTTECAENAYETVLTQSEVLRKAAQELAARYSKLVAENDLNNREIDVREAKHRTEVKILQTELEKANVELNRAKEELSSCQQEIKRLNSVHSSLESLKGHLQLQLKHRESECSRLGTQLRKADDKRSRELEETRAMVEHAQSALDLMRAKKETVKRAARAQKRRAERAETRLAEIERELSARDSMLAELRRELDNERTRAYRMERNRSRQREDMRAQEEEEREEKRQLQYLRERLEEMDQKTRETEEIVRLQLSAAPAQREAISGRSSGQRQSREPAREKAEEEGRRYNDGEEEDGDMEPIINNEKGDCVQQSLRMPTVLETEGPRSGQPNRPTQQPTRPLNTNISNQATAEPEEAGGTERRSTLQCRELEAVIAELRGQLAEARRDAEEVERRSTARLSELRAQLAQSDAANHSLQAYLAFLKRSYASIFGGSPPLLDLDEDAVAAEVAAADTDSHPPTTTVIAEPVADG